MVWIVVWLTRRWETRMDTISSSITAQTAALAAQTEAIAEISVFLRDHHTRMNENNISVAEKLTRVGELLQKTTPRSRP